MFPEYFNCHLLKLQPAFVGFGVCASYYQSPIGRCYLVPHFLKTIHCKSTSCTQSGHRFPAFPTLKKASKRLFPYIAKIKGLQKRDSVLTCDQTFHTQNNATLHLIHFIYFSRGALFRHDVHKSILLKYILLKCLFQKERKDTMDGTSDC